ncbi:MAG: hypothetical protein HYR84_09640 [Planctomycetes bacterium]|nr:hypothetical protein [Planctomycetota bacterium]
MRPLLLMALIFIAPGCQAMRDHIECRRECRASAPCGRCARCVTMGERPKETKPAERVAAPRPEVGEAARAAMAQEVLLVPRTVYVPYVAQAPTAPARLTSNMTVLPPQGPEPIGMGRPQVGDPNLAEALDACKKLQERITFLERCLSDRTIVVPQSGPAPQMRRPLLPRHDPLLPRCLPQCDSLQHCDPVTGPMLPADAKAGAITIE